MKDRYWIRSGFFTLMQNMSNVFFGFGSFYLLVRILDKTSFGTWALFMTTVTVMETIRNGLVQNALIKYLSFTPREDHPKIISASFANSGLLTLLCIGLNLGFSAYLGRSWHAPQLVGMFYLYSIVYLLSGVLTQFQFIEQANLAFRGIFFSTFIRQGLFFFFILFCWLFHWQLPLVYLVYVQIITVTLAALLSYGFVRKELGFSSRPELAWMKKLFAYGKYAFGTSVSSMIFGSIDQMMLGSFLSAAAAGGYNVAMRITNFVEIPTGSVAAIVFPQSAKRIETEGRDAVRYLYEKSVGTILAILLPGLLFLFLFSDFTVHVIAGEKYADTVPILKVTILYCLLIPYGRQFGTMLDSMGKPSLTFRVVLVCALINVGLNYLLIHRYGVIGAAYATLGANIIGFLIGQVILRRELGVNLGHTFLYAARFYPEMAGRLMHALRRPKP